MNGNFVSKLPFLFGRGDRTKPLRVFTALRPLRRFPSRTASLKNSRFKAVFLYARRLLKVRVLPSVKIKKQSPNKSDSVFLALTVNYHTNILAMQTAIDYFTVKLSTPIYKTKQKWGSNKHLHL